MTVLPQVPVVPESPERVRLLATTPVTASLNTALTVGAVVVNAPEPNANELIVGAVRSMLTVSDWVPLPA